MLVTMKTKIGGFRNGVEWPPIGGTIDVPDHEAADLVANGYAEPAAEPIAPTEEAADALEPADDQSPAGDDDLGGADDAGADDSDPEASADQDDAPTVDEVTEPPAAPARGRKSTKA